MHQELEKVKNEPPKVVVEKVVQKVEVPVIPHDYEDLQHHIHDLEEELIAIKRKPPKIKKEIKHVEVIPHDYEDL